MSEEKALAVVNQKVEKAVHKEPEFINYNPDDPVALYMQPSVFAQLQRVAKLMATSQLVPKHLQGDDKISDCFLVVAQAFRWRMDPFAVAQCSFVLSGKLGYEGKLIAAVINASPRLAVSLNYEYDGKGDDRRVRVFATLRGEDKPREVFGTVGEWATQNPKWKTMQDQMLSYRGAREWSRRHMPEAVLGVYADEEVEEIAIHPMTHVATPASLTVEAMSLAAEAPTQQKGLTVDSITSPQTVDAEDDGKPTAAPTKPPTTPTAAPTQRAKPKAAPVAPPPPPPPTPPEPVEIEDEQDVDPEDADVDSLFR